MRDPMHLPHDKNYNYPNGANSINPSIQKGQLKRFLPKYR
jgi:hypothetical protein